MLIYYVRPVDFTILFFQRDLVVVMILEYTRENRMIHFLTILTRSFWMVDSFVLFENS